MNTHDDAAIAYRISRVGIGTPFCGPRRRGPGRDCFGWGQEGRRPLVHLLVSFLFVAESFEQADSVGRMGAKFFSLFLEVTGAHIKAAVQVGPKNASLPKKIERRSARSN